MIKRAFQSSNCDDFASVLSRMTGWPVTTMTWQIPGYGFGHHAMVRDPEGQLLDVGGWTDEKHLREHFGIKSAIGVKWTEEHLSAPMFDEGDEACEMIEMTIRNLPYAPYDRPEFQAALGPPASSAP